MTEKKEIMTEKTQNMLRFVRSTLLWFLVFYLGMQWWQSRQAPPAETLTGTAEAMQIKPVDANMVLGQEIVFTLSQNGPAEALPAFVCENQTKPALFTPRGTEMVNLLAEVPCPELQTMFADEKGLLRTKISLSPLQTDLLNTPGEYLLEIPLSETPNGKKIVSPPLKLSSPSAFRLFFRNLLSKPIFNALIFITKSLPGQSFGLAIIILTLLIRSLLFVPSLNALKSQRAMQKIQPEIQKLQQKHKTDQQTMAKELMALYKRHNVSPVSGLLPVFLQLPVFLALYYTLQNGLPPHLMSFLYESVQQMGISFDAFNMNLLGLNMTEKNLFPLPVLVAGAQFLAFSGSMNAQGAAPQMAQMQKVMKWGLPILIGVFTASLPAAVGLYWLISTLFGYVQQLFLQKRSA